jgi:hypothetical protein
MKVVFVMEYLEGGELLELLECIKLIFILILEKKVLSDDEAKVYIK